MSAGKIHPRRKHIHEQTNLGDKIADKTTEQLGSWRFIIIQSLILALSILLNSVGWFYHWDAAPFILLNLCLSFQAAFTGPIVLLSQNRQAARDRKRDDTEAFEVENLFSSHELLLSINRQQLEILHLLKEQEPMTALIGKLDKHEQWQNEMLTKVSAALEKKPRTTRATKPEVVE